MKSVISTNKSLLWLFSTKLILVFKYQANSPKKLDKAKSLLLFEVYNLRGYIVVTLGKVKISNSG